MPEAKQLTFLEKLAAEKAEAQAVQLAKARRALTAAEDQLAQLQRYEAGYHTQLGEKLETSVPIDTLRGHHRFMHNVAHAVRQQEVEVARRRAYVDAVQRVWQETERRRQGFRVLADKVVKSERREDARRLQKTDDEFNTRTLLQSNVGL
jgi:flagellar export protein FliJ